jgi:hypothetical protein
MKKVKIDKKLSLDNLDKTTLSRLNETQMDKVNGGFTYAISTGDRCRASQLAGADNPYDCGLRLSAINLCRAVTI